MKRVSINWAVSAANKMVQQRLSSCPDNNTGVKLDPQILEHENDILKHKLEGRMGSCLSVYVALEVICHKVVVSMLYAVHERHEVLLPPEFPIRNHAQNLIKPFWRFENISLRTQQIHLHVTHALMSNNYKSP